VVILSLDPAACTGYCLIKIDNNAAEIYEYGFIDVDTNSNFQGDHCIDLMSRVEELIKHHNVQHITVEDYFFSQRFASGSNVNAAYRTAIHILACRLKIPYTILNISAWKTFVAGRSIPTKDQKKKWGATPAKKLFIQQALWERWGFRFPNHSLSSKTNKPVAFKFDIVDVVAQAVYYIGLVLGIRNIHLSVACPPDAVFKKYNKKQFIYP